MKFVSPPTLAFSHFGFPLAQVKCGSVHHLVPIGMPALRKELNDSVFYLYRRNAKGEIVGPEGTGFVIARAGDTAWPTAHYYAITNWHVAVRGGASIIRLNTRDGQTRDLEYDPHDWQFEPNGDDIAAVDITECFRETDQIFVQSEESFLTIDLILDYSIGFGEDVFMVGMFASHHGGERNIPAARFGNLSMLANEKATVQLENKARRPSHLVDMRSRGGFSGSPVYIYRTPYTDLSKPNMHRIGDPKTTFPLGQNGIASRKQWFVGLLGIHCGQFWEPIEVRKGSAAPEREGDPIVEGDRLSIQGGMTICAPAWQISRLLDSEVFETMRKQREPEMQDQRERAPRGESVDKGSPPATDENPQHLADFKRLVDVAARKRPQGD